MANRVIAVQIDLEFEAGKDYEELLNDIKEQINATGEFNCRGIGYTDDLTEQYKQYSKEG